MCRRCLFTMAFCACVTTCADRSEVLPSAPSTISNGIAVYDGVNFTGASGHIQADVADLSKFGNGPCEHSSGDDVVSDWDDCISSIRVTPGVRATVYVHPNFKGWGVTIDKDVPSLWFVLGPCRRASVNDCISSIRVTPR